MCAITRTIHVIALIPIIGVPMLVTILPDDFLTGPKPVEVEPDDTESKALVIWVPLTPAVYGNRSPFGDDGPDFLPFTTQNLFRRLVQFIMGLNWASLDWRGLLHEAARIVGEEVVKFLIATLVMFLWNKLTAETNDMSNDLNTTAKTTPSADAELQTSVETSDESAHSWPTTPPVDVELPEPREQSKCPESSQSESESASSDDDPMEDGFTELSQIPEPIDDQQHTGPPAVVSPRTNQNLYLHKPKTNVENQFYILHYYKLAETLTTIATFPVDAPEPSKRLRDKVDFIRAHKSVIELQAEGFCSIISLMEQVKQGVADLSAKAGFPVNKEFSDVGKSLAKLEATFAKECNVERLLKKIAYFEQLHREGTFERRGAWFRCGPKASRTTDHITEFMKQRQEYTEKFLREIRALSDIYNVNREWIMFMTAPRDSFF